MYPVTGEKWGGQVSGWAALLYRSVSPSLAFEMRTPAPEARGDCLEKRKGTGEEEKKGKKTTASSGRTSQKPAWGNSKPMPLVRKSHLIRVRLQPPGEGCSDPPSPHYTHITTAAIATTTTPGVDVSTRRPVQTIVYPRPTTPPTPTRCRGAGEGHAGGHARTMPLSTGQATVRPVHA